MWLSGLPKPLSRGLYAGKPGDLIFPFQSSPLPPLSASDPDEIYKIHEIKMKRDRASEAEEDLDQLIDLSRQELTLLAENQENLLYPPKP